MRRELDEKDLRLLFEQTREAATEAQVAAVVARVTAARRPRRTRPIRIGLAAAAVATAAAALVLVAGDAPRSGGPASASAAEVLRRAASAPPPAAPAPRPGSYAYLRYRFHMTALGAAPADRGTVEQWLRRDGRGLSVVEHSAAWARAAGPGGRRVERIRTAASSRPFVAGAERFSYGELRRLAASPGRVERLVAAEARRLGVAGALAPADRTAYAAYAVLSDVLLAPGAVALQQQVYRRLADHPRLRLVTDTPTAATVAADAGDLRFEIAVNPATGELLSLERRLLRRSRQLPGPPRVVNRIDVVARGVTDRAGERPAAP